MIYINKRIIFLLIVSLTTFFVGASAQTRQTKEEYIEKFRAINADPSIHGILAFRPRQ